MLAPLDTPSPDPRDALTVFREVLERLETVLIGQHENWS